MSAVRRRGRLELSASIRVCTFQVVALMCRDFANCLRCRRDVSRRTVRYR